MSVVHKIINDSAVLSNMINDDQGDELDIKDMSIEELDNLFSGTKKPYLKNIISKIAPMYEGIYPIFEEMVPRDIVNFINGVHHLQTSKEMDILLLLYFYPGKNDILPFLSEDFEFELKEIDNEEFKNLKDALISYERLDLLKFKNYTFNRREFRDSLSRSVEIIQYVWDNRNEEIDIHANNDRLFADVCLSSKYRKNLDAVKWLWNLEPERTINIHTATSFNPYSSKRVTNAKDSIFAYALVSDNLLLAKWLLEISKDPKVGPIDFESIINNHYLEIAMKKDVFNWLRTLRN